GGRDGRARLADGARRSRWEDCLARLQHWTRQGLSHRSQVQTVLRLGQRERPWGCELAAGPVEDWRWDRVGLGFIRFGSGSDLLRHGKSGTVESRAASWRQ